MAYAKINSITNANMAKVNSAAKAALGKIGSIDAPAGAGFTNTYSIAFGGTDDYVAMSSLAYDTGSWVMWVKYEGTATGNMILMNAGSDYYLYATANVSGGNLGFLYPGRASLTTWPAPGGDAGVGDESWHQLAMTIARPGDIGTTATVKIYLDGVLKDTQTGTRIFTNSADVLYFGRYSSSALYYTGNMDEIGWWSEHTLTDAEVTQLYNSGEPIDLQTDSGNYSSSGNLTSYWRMGDGDTFATITDSEGDNDGTMTNMTSGDIETDPPVAFDTYSILLDGVDDHMTADGALGVISGDLGSFSMWVQLEPYPYSESIFSGRVDVNNFVWCYYHGGTNQLRLEHKGGGNEDTLVTTTVIENNGWHHIACTWDTSANQMAMYVDGSSADTGTASSDFTGAFTGIDFGKRRDTSWLQFEGNMNDIALFDDVLTSGEVSAIYNSGAPKNESSHGGLVGYWKMEENTGTSVADSSSNSNAITLVNGAAFAADTP